MAQFWNDVLASAPPSTEAGAAHLPYAQHRRWEWALLGLLLGIHAALDGLIEHTRMRLELTALAPAVAAWAVLRFGPGAIPALLAYALLPRLGWRMAGFDLSWAPPAWPAVMVGVAAGAWWSAQQDPAPWRGLWHKRRWPWAMAALVLLVLGALEWPPMRLPTEALGLRWTPLGFVAMLALLMLPQWRAWMVRARALGGRPAMLATVLLPPLAAWLGATSLSVNVGGPWIGWGSTVGLPLAVALLAAGLLWNWPMARAWAAAVLLPGLIEAWRLGSDRPPLASAWIDYGRELRWLPGAPVALDALCNACMAVVVVLLLKAVGPARQQSVASGPPAGPAAVPDPGGPVAHWAFWGLAWLGAVLALVLPALAESPYAQFLAQDTRGWMLGGLAFALGTRYGLPAVVWAPPALGAIAVAGLLPSTVEQAIGPLATHAVGVVALVASWACIGWLVHRARRPLAAATVSPVAPASDGGAALIVPIDGLGRLVHRLDVSATLSSFGVLLTVLLVSWVLVESGAISVMAQSFGTDAGELDWAEDGPMVALVVLASALAALLPLSFLVVDAANRSDRMQPVSGLTGAVLAAPLAVLGTAVVAGLCAAAAAVLVERGIGPIPLAVLLGLWASGLLLAGAGRLRGRGGRAGFGLLLLLVPALLWVAGRWWAAGAEVKDGASLPLQVAGSVAVLVVLATTLLRAVSLRADLALPLPRHWLFGEIPGGGFWPRLAALLGLPASMWRRSALREAAFWLLLLARPLVYLGAGVGLSSRWWLGLGLMVAGHASLLAGKRLAARVIWQPDDLTAHPHPVLFLRGFDDDQFDFRLRGPNLLKRWLALWSFRRNLDEALVDEVDRYGAVVALARPGEVDALFGAARHRSEHDNWRGTVLQTARQARAIVMAAGHTPGVLWEYEMLEREGLLERTLLLFHPGAAAAEGNRAALQVYPLPAAQRATLMRHTNAGQWVALLNDGDRWALLTAAEATPAHHVLALRLHFQRAQIATLGRRAAMLPAPRWPALV